MSSPVFLDPPSKSRAHQPNFFWRDLGRRLPLIASGMASGLVAGFFLLELGISPILGGLDPQVVIFSLAIVGALLGAWRQRWTMLAVDGFLLVVYLIVTDTPVMFNAAGAWVRQDPMPTTADAIVVLSSSVNSSGVLDDEGVQRLLTGIELYRTGVAPRLFTTAVDATYGGLVRSSTADQERLVTLGGARQAWTSLTGTYTTHDEAMQAAGQLPTGAHTVVVVTTPLHTRRACATFEAVGFDVICRPSREQEFVAWHPLDSRDRLESFRQYLYERLGMVKYRAKGWLPKQR